MRGRDAAFLAAFAISQLLGVSARAAAPVKLAFSETMGVAVFAYPDGRSEWCRAKLAISILVRDDSTLLKDGVDGMLPKLGALFVEKCPAATSAAIAVYKASDHSLIGKSFTVTKGDNWSRVPEGQASSAPLNAPEAASASVPSSAPQDAPPPPAQCDQMPIARNYFIAACIVRGLEIHRQSDGLEAARTRQSDSGKALNCTPQSMTRVTDMAMQAAVRIVNSGAISALMDFGDGMQVECRKAATDFLK